jgi:hypothetical protein
MEFTHAENNARAKRTHMPGDADKGAWKQHDATELMAAYTGPKWVGWLVGRLVELAFVLMRVFACSRCAL